jgi:hypothetical protein
LAVDVRLQRSRCLQPTAGEIDGSFAEPDRPVGVAHLAGDAQPCQRQLRLEASKLCIGESATGRGFSGEPERCPQLHIVLSISVIAGRVIVEMADAQGRRAGRQSPGPAPASYNFNATRFQGGDLGVLRPCALEHLPHVASVRRADTHTE